MVIYGISYQHVSTIYNKTTMKDLIKTCEKTLFQDYAFTCEWFMREYKGNTKIARAVVKRISASLSVLPKNIQSLSNYLGQNNKIYKVNI